MPHHQVKTISNHLSSWWHRLPHLQKIFLFGTGLLAGIAIPLSVNAINTPVTLLPRAYGESSPLNRPPQFPSQTLHCNTTSPCLAQVKAFDPDAADRLSLSIDFLPSQLTLSSCDNQISFGGKLTHICYLEGLIPKSGEYKLLGTVSDDAGDSTSQIITLKVR